MTNQWFGWSVFVYWLVSMLTVGTCGCWLGATDANSKTEVTVVHGLGVAANEVIMELAAAEKAEGMAAIHAASSAADAEQRLVDVERRWAPVWAAVAVFRAAHDTYADALETGADTGGLLVKLRESYCDVRTAAAQLATELPDFPGAPCP